MRWAGAARGASFTAGLALIASVAIGEPRTAPRVAPEACARCGVVDATAAERPEANRWYEAPRAAGRVASASSPRWTRARMFWRTASDLALVAPIAWPSRIALRG
jgi:hypothetical protein